MSFSPFFSSLAVTDESLSRISPSVPCTPEIGGALLDCYTDSVLLEWAYVKGAVTYNATATAAGGQQSSCYGNYTNCELLDLTCGQAYTITMVASDGQCDSFQSASVEVASG